MKIYSLRGGCTIALTYHCVLPLLPPPLPLPLLCFPIEKISPLARPFVLHEHITSFSPLKRVSVSKGSANWQRALSY